MNLLAMRQGERRAKALFEEWLGDSVSFEPPHGNGPDLLVRHGRTLLVVELKVGARPMIGEAIDQVLRHASQAGRNAVPVVAVPFMSEAGRELCARRSVSWFDLSGNARITSAGLLIHVEGKPNQYKRRGRPSTVFAARSSRIARQLLLEPDRSFQQRELAQKSGLDEGFTSRVVRKLEEDAMVQRAKDGTVAVRDPDALLDAWREVYDFDKHTVIRGHLPGRSSEEGQKRLLEALAKKKLRCAATGLGAAWLQTKFANFRLSTVFVEEEPAASVLEALGFRQQERGANLWLVIPNDDAVFAGERPLDGVPCVHPLQMYLDLKAHPERAVAAAEELRRQCLSWER